MTNEERRSNRKEIMTSWDTRSAPSNDERAIFEISEEDFRKSFWMRATVLQRNFAILALVLIPMFAILLVRDAGIDVIGVAAIGGGYLLIIWVVWSKVRQIRRLNRFGIFRGGIAPFRKPKSSSVRRDRWIIPYTLIDGIEYWSDGRSPDVPFGASITLRDGTLLNIESIDIVSLTRGGRSKIADARSAIRALADEFNRWRRTGSNLPFVFTGEEFHRP